MSSDSESESPTRTSRHRNFVFSDSDSSSDDSPRVRRVAAPSSQLSPSRRRVGTGRSFKRDRFIRPLRADEEIFYLQTTSHLLIPRLNFSRLVKEVTQRIYEKPYYFATAALEALQEGTEYFLIELFEDSHLMALHAKRITIKIDDFRMARRFRSTC